MLENTYSQVTQDIQVEVVPVYVPEQSQFPQQHLFTYNISITNHSNDTCQLLQRHWIIVDGKGHREDVHGEGVVGEQPILKPGQCYQYSSYCPLPTPTGNMRGFFTFINSKGIEFQIPVPVFFLRQDALIQ